jgi:AcrR family transcriptional regulator
MATDTRDRMVTAATRLFAERGYDATGFRDIVDQASAARGAIYHHFPEGKAELGESVALRAGGHLADVVARLCATQSPEQALAALFDLVTDALVETPHRPGCPITAVTLAADDPDGRLRAAGAGVFARLQAAVRDCLARDGVPDQQAVTTAALVVCAAEGAVILCRAEGNRRPIDLVRGALLQQLALLPRDVADPSPPPRM